MQMDRSLGFLVVGFIRIPEEKNEQYSSIGGCPIYDIEDLEKIIKEHNVEELIIALDSKNKRALHRPVYRLYPKKLPIQ